MSDRSIHEGDDRWHVHDGIWCPEGLLANAIVEVETTEGRRYIDSVGEIEWDNDLLVNGPVGRDEVVRWRMHEGELPPAPGFTILAVEGENGDLEMIGQHGKHLYRLVGLKLDGGHADKGVGTIRFTYEDAAPMMGREIDEFRERLSRA